MTSFIIIAAVIIIGFTLYLRRDKPDERTTWRYYQAGYPIVEVNRKLGSREEGEDIQQRLYEALDTTWQVAILVHGFVPKGPPAVSKIGVAAVPPSKEHPLVQYNIGANSIQLKADEDMYYWFVRECYNVYRYQMYGRPWITEPKDEADRAKAQEVIEALMKLYGRLDGD